MFESENGQEFFNYVYSVVLMSLWFGTDGASYRIPVYFPTKITQWQYVVKMYLTYQVQDENWFEVFEAT